jgi:hypothetical protein
MFTDGFFLVGLANVDADRPQSAASEEALLVRRAAGQ